MKKKYILSVFILISINLFSFGRKEEVIDARNKVIVGLILDEVGLGDRLVNDSCYLGLEKLAQEGEITLRTLSITPEKNFSAITNEFKSFGAGYIFVIGEKHKKYLLNEAAINKDITFVGVDIIFKPTELKPNISGISFYEQEGGYLAGLLAGNMTYKYHKKHNLLNEANKVGIILGKATPENKRYELGFYAGVKEVNPPCEIITVDINDLNNPEKGESAVKQLKNKGVDIVFAVAGDSEPGIFKSAIEHGVLIIGSNKDRSLESEMVLTSVIKELSVSSYLMSKNLLSGDYLGGENVYYGVTEKAIYLSSFNLYDKYIPRDVKKYIRNSAGKMSGRSDFIPSSIAEIQYNPEDIPEIID